jgi:hypothetical protein
MLADRNERPDLANQFALGLARAGDSEKTSAMYHKLLIWLSSNMNAKLFQRLPIGRGVETEHSSFKRYTALCWLFRQERSYQQ